MKATAEIVTMFWSKDGDMTGFLHENGHREIYTVKRATKTELAKLFETEQPI
jgi:hypothetical protein